MSPTGKFTLKDQGVRLWLLGVFAVGLFLLASRERGWWIWGILGLSFFRDLSWSRQWFRRTADGRWSKWGTGPEYLTTYEGCRLWAGVILLATMGIGFILF